MIRGRCPTCSKPYEITAVEALRSFPFCSDRCRLIDLGRWADGKHSIPGPPLSQRREEDPNASSEDDDD